MGLKSNASSKQMNNPAFVNETEAALQRVAMEMQDRFSVPEVIRQIRGFSFGKNSDGSYTAHFKLGRNVGYEAIVTDKTLYIWRGRPPSDSCPDEDGIRVAEYADLSVSRFYKSLGRRRPAPVFFGPVGT